MDGPGEPSGPIAVARRRAVRAWVLYDWANSAFATTVMAALFPPFFRELAMASGLEPAVATAAWGYVTAGTLLVIALAAPLLGAAADRSGRTRGMLATSAAVGIVFTGLLAFIGDGQWRLAGALFAAANLGFSASIVFYESLLPRIVPAGDLDRISARGYAMGYLGGGLLLVINAFWVLQPAWFGFAGPGAAVRAAFVSVAVWWALFSLPLLRHAPRSPAGPGGARHDAGGVAAGLRRPLRTLAELRRYPQLLLFLVAYWIYNDGIGTIIKMATAFGSEVGIATGHLVAALVITQFVGFPCTLFFGRLAGRIGPRRAVTAGLAVYVLISLGGYFLRSAWQFYVLAALVGTVQGGTQALSRSLFASMVPRHRSAQFFGFYSTSGKLAGIAGPLVFGAISHLTGASRISSVVMAGFFVAGGLLLARVDLEAGRAAARRAERSCQGNRVLPRPDP
ncbi:MAG: MFS transporter [Candidatus Krumholzibacteriia bacterium]